MPIDASAVMVRDAIASVEEVGSHIEDIFVQVGDHLGRGHTIFQELNDGLALLSRELSGAEIEGASSALQSVAAKLVGLADSLPHESELLGVIGTSAAKAAMVLKPLVKQIHLIMIIARSARIEAASLDTNQASFLDFTQEAFDLAKSVQGSIEACAHDQERLSSAVKVALARQHDFEANYIGQLVTVSADLISAYSGMQDRQTRSARVAELTGASTKRMTEAVGSAIVSLQAGDSTRQRLEHICYGLNLANDPEAGIVPAMMADTEASAKPLICQLQAAQLRSTISDFDADIGAIDRSLEGLISDAAGIVVHGHSLYDGQDGDTASFLSVVKSALAQASILIATCESSRKLVDDALSVVEDTLGKFRIATAGLSETIVDIILIGMNAGLKAGHLGAQGSAFAVIASELKLTADEIAKGAGMLPPVLDDIEHSAHGLKALRVEGDPAHLARLEPSILFAIQEIEAGNVQLGQLMGCLIEEGAEFESLMTNGRSLLTTLRGKTISLPDVAMGLGGVAPSAASLSLCNAQCVESLFADMYAQYTMASERDVYTEFSQRMGFTHQPVSGEVEHDENKMDDVLFF